MALESILNSLGGESRIHLGLDNFKRALKTIGNPEAQVKSIVIGGTNGKGTTSLFVSHVMNCHGLNVGTFLSPHLHDVSERFLNNVNPIPSNELEELGERFSRVGLEFQLTYFEFLTLLYFVWAREKRFDISILEVGLGGRLDATNVTCPIACVITNISLDHQKFLGNSLTEILIEKLGITRPGTPLLTGVTEADLRSKCLEYGHTNQFPVEFNSVTAKVHKRTWENQTVSLDDNVFTLTNPSPGTLENAKLAYQLIRRIFPEISIATIKRGFESTQNPGRFEYVPGIPPVILSGDHNLAGVHCLIETFKNLPKTNIHTVCAFSLDKDYAQMFKLLKGISSTIHLTRFAKQGSNVPESYFRMGEVNPDPVETFQKLKVSVPPDSTILVTGSLYLVGQIRNTIRSTVLSQLSSGSAI